MRYSKTLGLAVVGACALLAFASSASATVLTSPTGTQYGGTIKAELKEGESILKNSFIGEYKCMKSTIEGTVESQGTGVTAKSKLGTLDFTGCPGPVTVLKTGTLEIHHTSGYDGTLTSSGTELTTELVGLHCIFSTNNTNLGRVTGGAPAEFTAASAAIPRTAGRSGAFCGSSASWNAVYKVASPNSLYIDA